jgi:capsular polysaccharide biosynthesis protein
MIKDFEMSLFFDLQKILKKILIRLDQYLLAWNFYTYLLCPAFEKSLKLILELYKPSYPEVITDLKDHAFSHGLPFKICQPNTTQVYYPSKTIQEEIVDILKNGKIRVKNYYGSRATHSVARGESLYSQLYSVNSETIRETFRCEISNIKIINPGGLVLSTDYKLIEQSIDHSYNSQLPTLDELRKILSSQTLTLRGVYVSLLTRRGWQRGNYAHWLMDALPRLDILSSLDSETKVIVPSKPYLFIFESLSILGISRERVIEADFQVASVEKLVLAHAAQYTGLPSKVHLCNIHKKLRTSVLGNHDTTISYRKVYISRAKVARGIINEEEIFSILSDYGFERLFCEDLSFVEQVKIFAETSVIVGPHGAGMYNQVFCNSNTIIIEIYNREYWNQSTRTISSLLGNLHWHIFGNTVGKNWLTWVDPDRFRKLLSLAIGC